MRFNAKVIVEWEEDSFFCGLNMRVKFKLPNHLFRKTLYDTLTSDAWIIGKHYEDKQAFWNDCFKKLGNKDYLKARAKELVIDYLKSKYKETETDENKRKIAKLLQSVNKDFEIEIEYHKS